MKSVQIPEELFFQICRLCLQTSEELEDWEAEELNQAVQSGLQAKLEAMQRRQLYTLYKDTRAAPEAREAARQAYLDMVGMFPAWRCEGLEPPV